MGRLVVEPLEAQAGSPEWQAWLDRTQANSFRYEAADGSFSARREQKRGSAYWYAYRKVAGRLRKAYLGRTSDLTASKLATAAAQLAEPQLPPDAEADPSQAARAEARSTPRLPVPPTPLVGRERTIGAITRKLLDPQVRLLTLTGPGGTGKTRLALAVATALLHEFKQRVWFVDLSSITDAGLVIREVAQRLGIADTAEQPVRDRLFQYLAEDRGLLVLDNFEQVQSGALEAADLVEACSELTILVTSREPLHLRAESQYAVPPLGVPDARHLDRASIERSAAVTLFMLRADAAGAPIDGSDQALRAVAELCSRLDGLPLAIELAAARSKLLSPATMLARLERTLDVLRSSEPDRAARHRSVRAAVAWSFDLLAPEEQVAFRRLAVFVGGCTLEAAEAMGLADAFDAVASLVDKSLLRMEQTTAGESRLRMLQTIRAFALEQLEATGEADEIRRRHAEYFRSLFPSSERIFEVLPTPEWLDRLATEHDNLRAALRWALDTDNAQLALELALAVQTLWVFRGFLREGLQWTEEVLARSAGRAPDQEAWAHYAAGQLAWRQGEVVRAEAHYEAAVALRRGLGDQFGIAHALQGLASIARDTGDPARAVTLYEESLAVFRAANNRPRQVRCMLNLAIALHLATESGRAATLLDETATLARDIGQPWAHANALAYRALIALEVEHEPRRAAALLVQGLGLVEEAHDDWVPMLFLELSAWLAVELGSEVEISARLLASAAQQRARIGAHLPMAFRVSHARYATTAHLAALAAAPDLGDALELATTTLRALLDARASVDRQPAIELLSAREREIATLVARGLSTREIAEQLIVSERTVETHIDHVRSKLGLRSRVQIAAWAVARGLAQSLS